MCSEPKAIDPRTALRLKRLTRASNSLDLVGSDPRFQLQNFESGSADPQKCDLYFSHEMLSSNGSSTDQSGHTESSSKTSLNSGESYDTMLNRKYSSSLSGSQTNINARQLRLTERKSSVPENQGHSHSRKPKKDVRRAEIVAAVTRRLYTTKKRPDVKTEQEEPVKEEKFEDDDDEPEELKLCSRARAKLQEISKRAMNVQKKVKNADTQTDLTPTLRVKEISVNTCSSGIVRTADICLHTDDTMPVALHKEVAVNTDVESCGSFQNRLKCVRCSCFRKSLRTVLYKEASVSTSSADHDGQSDILSISEESVNCTDDFAPDKSRFRDYCGCSCHSVAQSSNSRSLSKTILCPLHTDPTNQRESCWDYTKHVGTQADNLPNDLVKCCPTRRAESSVQTSWTQDAGTNTQHNSLITTVGVQTTTDAAVNTHISAVNSPLIEVKDTIIQSDDKIIQTHEAIETISETFGSFLPKRNKTTLTFYALRNTTGTVTDTALWTTNLCEKYYLNVLSRSKREAAQAQQLKLSTLMKRGQDEQPAVYHSRNNTQDENFSDDSLESQQSVISCNEEVIEPEINEEPKVLKANRTKSRKDVCLHRNNVPVPETRDNRNPATLSQKTEKSNHICCRKLQPDFQSRSYRCPAEASSLRNCCLHNKNADNEIFLRNRRGTSQHYSPTCKMKDCYCDCRKANLTTSASKMHSRTTSYADIPMSDATKEYANDPEYTENHEPLNVYTDFESELGNQEVVSPDFSISHNAGEKNSGEVPDDLTQAEKKRHELSAQSVSRCDCVEHCICCRSLRSTPCVKTCTQHVSCHSTVPEGNITFSNNIKNSSVNNNPIQTILGNVCSREGFANCASEMSDSVSENKVTVRSNISKDFVNKKINCMGMPYARFPENAQEEASVRSDVNDQNVVFEERAIHPSSCTSNLHTEPISENISAKEHKSDIILADDVSQCHSSDNNKHFRTNQKGQCHTKSTSPSLQSTGNLQESGNKNLGDSLYSDLTAQNNNFPTKMRIVEETIITNSTVPLSNPKIPESRLEFTIMSDSINVYVMGSNKQVQSSNAMRRNNFNSVKIESGTQTNCTYDNKQECLGKDTDICSQEVNHTGAIPKSDVNYSSTSVQREHIKYVLSSSPNISVEQKIFKNDQESVKNAQEEFSGPISSPVITSGNETNESSFQSQQNKAENLCEAKNDVIAANESRDSEQMDISSVQLSNQFITESPSVQKKSTAMSNKSMQIPECNRNSHNTTNKQPTKEKVSAISPSAAKKRVSKKKLRSHLSPLQGNRLGAGAGSSLTTQGWGNAGAVGTWFTLSAFVRKASSLLRNLTEVTQMMENSKKLITKAHPFESNTSYVIEPSPLFSSKENETAIQSASYETLIPTTTRPAETRNFTFCNEETLMANFGKQTQLSDLPKVVSACNKNVSSETYYPRNISSAQKLYHGTADTRYYTADVDTSAVNTNHKAEDPHLDYSDYCTYKENSTTGIEDLDVAENYLQATDNAMRSESHCERSFDCSNNTRGNSFFPPSVNNEPLLTNRFDSQRNQNTTAHYRLKLSDHTLISPPENNRTDKLHFVHHPGSINAHDEDPVYTRNSDIRAQFPWAHLHNRTRFDNCLPDPRTSVSQKSFVTTHKNVTENIWNANTSVDKVSIIFPSHAKTKNQVENSRYNKTNVNSSSPPIFSDNDHCCFGNIFTTIMNYHQQKKHLCPLPYQSSSDRDRFCTSAGVTVPTCTANFIRYTPKTNVLRDSDKLINKNIVINAPRPNSDYIGCSPRVYKQYLLSVRRKIATDSGYNLKTSADITQTDHVNKY